ncbi:hypothetical protein G5V58_00570 [Nocardioides anomalus]|uniref:DUF11 domain-containing protein n=1 Tax=Nocardioides anomalus TaxID=2712223 RepID=A0A6G6W8C0_9ACTN|nr:Ig-like domain-containing protein [Nocardioides anomalus]QIG41466.1 hypothetical protein G5V58_00570 [Nocardioides anomalus]
MGRRLRRFLLLARAQASRRDDRPDAGGLRGFAPREVLAVRACVPGRTAARRPTKPDGDPMHAMSAPSPATAPPRRRRDSVRLLAVTAVVAVVAGVLAVGPASAEPATVGADLSLSLAAAPTSVPAGGTVSFAVSTSNLGPEATEAVTAAVTLASNLTFQSATGAGWSCGASGQVVKCTRPSAAVAALPDITISARATGAVTGTVDVSGAISAVNSVDYVSGNDSATAAFTVTAATDLAVTTAASTGSPASGQAMSFTLRPRNLGPFAATSVVAEATLPAGFAVVAATGTGWTCSTSGADVTCTRATYAVGAANDVTITATAPMVLGPTAFTVAVQLSSATPDPVSANDVGSVSVTVLPDGVDLSITETKGPSPVAQGSGLTHDVRVVNHGPRAAVTGEVTVTDTLPAGEGFVSASGTGWTCGAAGSVVTCTYASALGAGSSSSDLRVATTALVAGTLTDTACVSYTDSGGHGYADPQSGNNCANASVVSTVASGAVDLSLSGTTSSDPLVWNEGSLDYTLTVANAGPGDATGLVLTDAIPGHVAGASGVVASKTGGTSTSTFACSNGATVTCTQTGGTLAAGTTAVFTVTVSRPLRDSAAQPGGTWTNTATVTSTDQGDTDVSNNSASVPVRIDPVTDLTVRSELASPSVRAGTGATVVLTVENHGPSTAKSVTLSDVLTEPAGTLTFLSASPGQGSCAAYDAGTGTLTCSLGDIAEDGTAAVRVLFRPDHLSSPPSPRTISSDATVSMTTQDSDTTNNAAQSVLTVDPALVDLRVNATDNPDPLGFVPASAGPTFPDNVVTYRNVITNRGPSVASGVVLTSTMTPPAGKQATFLGDKPTSTGQSYSNHCDNLNTSVTGPATLTVTCTLPAGFVLGSANSSTDLYLDYRIDTPPDVAGDAFTTTASVASNETDAFLGDNSVTQPTTVRMRADLQLAESARAHVSGSDATTTTVQVRQPFYWVLTLSNAGPGDSPDTQIIDTLPAGVSLYSGGPVAPYDAAPYSSGVRWSTNNATPTSGSCSGTTTITCSIGLLESGSVALVRVPVVSVTAGSRNSCASATTSEVDPNAANNSSICRSVTVRESSLAGTVYADLNGNGAKGSGEPGINNTSMRLTGTDRYGNVVDSTTTTNSSGAYSFLHLADGTYTLTETQPSGYRDGRDAAGTAGGTVSGTGVGSDAITDISLAGNTAATGYLFGELVPPGVPVLTAPAPDASVASATPTIAGTGDVGGTVTVVIDGAAVGTAPVSSGGAWSLVVPSPLSQGAHTVAAFATDPLGTDSDPTSSRSFRVDSTAPGAPVVSAPVEGASLTTTTPTITGTAEPLATVSVSIDGGEVGTTPVPSGGAWSLAVTSPLSQGSHTVTTRARDAAGNDSSSSADRSFVVDTVAPAPPAVTAPADGAYATTTTPTLGGTAEPLSTVTVRVDDAVVGTTTAGSGGAWALAVPAALSQGVHTASARATDAAGNDGVFSASSTFTVDSVAPAAPVVTSPEDGGTVTSETPTVSGTAEPLSSVAVRVDGAVVGSTSAGSGGAWSLALTTPLSETTHVVAARATDAAGNDGAFSTEQHFTVRLPAAPSITSADHATFLLGSRGAFTVTTSPGYPSATVLSVVGTLPSGVTLTDRGDGTAALAGTPGPDTAGRYPLTVTATNVAGHVDQPFTLTVARGVFAVGPPTITGGPATFGVPLACAADLIPGDTATYTWRRGGTEVARGPGYTPAASDVGAVLTCAVTVSRPGFADATNQASTTPVAAAPAAGFDVTLRGGPYVHRVLRAVLTPAPPPGATVRWTWTVGGRPRPDATGSSYRSTLADFGRRVVARATVSRPGLRDARARGAVQRVSLAALRVSTRPVVSTQGRAFELTARHLLPGQRYVVRFAHGRVVARGTVPDDAESLTRIIRIPGRVTPGVRRLVFTTSDPDRRRAFSVRLP